MFFFPLFKGEKIIYSSAAVGNLSPGQSPYVRDLQGNVLSDSIIFIDNYGFVLRSCETESVFIRYSGSEFTIVGNLKDDGLIYSDAKYNVTQENYSTDESLFYTTSIITKESLKAIIGTDVFEIYGLGEIGALEIVSGAGSDMTKWPKAKHFVYCNLCPNNKIPGAKILSNQVGKG